MSVVRSIPFNCPYTTGTELRYVQEAIDAGHLSASGAFTARCTGWLEDRIGCAKVFLTQSCTAALELVGILCGVGDGDEVIMPSFTFPSTANAFALRGAVPVFVDIRPDTLNINARHIQNAVTSRTKAIVVVHYAGVACEMDEIMAIAQRNRLIVIEDAAHAVLAEYRGRPLGSIGTFGAFSFHETKNLMCGEGGALVIRDPVWIDRAELLYEKGTSRRRFLRGEIDAYSWVDLGSSFGLSEINAAFLWAQLEGADEIVRRRMEVWSLYHEALAPAEAAGLIRRAIVPPDRQHAAHLYYLLVSNRATRSRLISGLSSRRIGAVFHYVPLHSSPAGRRFGRTHGHLSVTEEASDRVVRLPLWVGMQENDVQRVVAAITEIVADCRPCPAPAD